MPIAVMKDRWVNYTDYYNSVFIELEDGRARVIGVETFEYLYHRLGNFRTALKEHCIEFCFFDARFNNYDEEFEDSDHPYWFEDILYSGMVSIGSKGSFMFINGKRHKLTSDSVILKNHLGDIRVMKYSNFMKYYEL